MKEVLQVYYQKSKLYKFLLNSTKVSDLIHSASGPDLEICLLADETIFDTIL